MAKSAFLKSSIAKKYWMALTGLFLCLFLVGHLLGNLQLFMSGYEGALQFNKYAYFMTTNPAVKLLSYVTYLSILFHAIDGIYLAIQNKKARPIAYAMNNPSKNSSSASRNMAVLGTMILIFIATHMINFWAKMKFGTAMPLFVKEIVDQTSGTKQYMLIASAESPQQNVPVQSPVFNNEVLKQQSKGELFIDGSKIINKKNNEVLFEGYKDLHKLTISFFKSKGKLFNVIPNEGLFFTLFYVFSMVVLGFHLWHGFQSAFQSLGINGKFTPAIKFFGKAFSVVVATLFAIIPLYIHFFSK
ncbi:MAG: succinate dehydrogenase [Flavobacteria bacterium RIFCSPLOWO2_12_FULL_31_7]|jgi:succinate dehydrogenase / fumarate reductase cytochrome b subunit|nr:MAG: succinate dehydrogenase [Flavobacteria bacterium RIFCSPLOWO2_12_FULL_31_7]